MSELTVFWRTLILTAVAMSTAAPLCMGQQLIRVTPGAGQLGFQFNGTWRGNGHLVSTANRDFNSWLSVPFSGALSDPRLVSYSLTLRPRLRRNSSNDIPDPIDGRSLDLDLSTRLLSASPVTLTFDWNRTAGSASGGFGTTSDFSNSGLTTVLSYPNKLLSTSLRFSRQDVETSSRVGIALVPFELSHLTETVRLAASNRKITLALGAVQFKDRSGTSDYSTWDAQVNHWFRWGKGSSLQSVFSYVDRDFRSDYTRSTWRERLHLQHTSKTASELRYERNTSTNGAGAFSNNLFSAEIDSRVKRWLAAGLTGSTRSSRQGDLAQSTYDVAPHVGVNLELPMQARLTGSASAGYQRRRVDEGLGFVQIVNQLQRFDGTGSLFINRSNVDTASVVVRSSDETVVFLPGLDYRIASAGSSVEIRILPGGRIAAGESVALSFRFRPETDTRQNIVFTRLSLAIRTHGITVRHNQSRRSSDTSGEDFLEFAGDFSQTLTGLSGSHRTRAGHLRVDLTRQSRDSEILDYVAYEARAGLILPPHLGYHVQVDLTARRTREGSRRVGSFAARPSFKWNLTRSVDLDAAVNYWRWKQRGGRTETSYGADLGLGWRFASTETNLYYGYERRRFDRTVAGSRFRLSLVRRF